MAEATKSAMERGRTADMIGSKLQISLRMSAAESHHLDPLTPHHGGVGRVDFYRAEDTRWCVLSGAGDQQVNGKWQPHECPTNLHMAITGNDAEGSYGSKG